MCDAGHPRKGTLQVLEIEGCPMLRFRSQNLEHLEEARRLMGDPFHLPPLDVRLTPALEINLCLPAQGASGSSAKSILPGA